MKVLFVYATQTECHAVRPRLDSLAGSLGIQVDHLITGIGGVATTHHLTLALQKQAYDNVINLGVAGCFTRDYALGDAVEITRDCFSELGAESEDGFLPLAHLGLPEGSGVEASAGWIEPQPPEWARPLELPRLSGISVNTVHGVQSSIDHVVKLYHPQVESMEGASVFWVARQMQVSCAQMRTLSNYVTVRKRAEWKLDLALRNLSQSAEHCLNCLHHAD